MRRHRFEPGALVMGLVLLFLSTAFVLDACGVWDLSDPDRTLTMAAAAVGAAAGVASLTQVVRIVRGFRARRRTRGRPAAEGRPYDAA